jgi:peroxiredoxin
MKKLILSLLALTVFFAGSSIKNGYEIGDIATDFKLKNVDGKMISLTDYSSAKGFIVIFDCNTCPVSKAYNSRIIALNKKYAPQDFPLIAINPNSAEVSAGESYEEMVKIAKKKGYEFPYLYDESQQVAKTYGATNTPHVFVLKKTGNELKVAYIGAIDDSSRDADGASKKYVEQAIDEILAGKPVSVTKTKAIGCGVKWKNA